MEHRHHDLVVIGTGSGNSVVTPRLDHLDIGLVEKGRFGGTCLNVGCIPTKMFVLPADRVVEAREADRLGVHVDGVRADWPAIRDRIFARIDPISADGEAYREKADNVTVYRQEARFTGPMSLDTGTGVTVTADRWVIAAGGRPRLLDVDGLDRVDPERGVHTSDTVMRMESLPERVVIVGGGFIAAEFAHILEGLGSHVTWVHRGERLLQRQDESVSRAYTQIAQARHDVRLRTTVTGARHDGHRWTLSTTTEGGEPARIEADAVLLAVGRIVNTDLLDVAAAGLPCHQDGRLVVDSFQQTPVGGVFALGDISSEWQLKHVANHEMRVVKHNLLFPENPVESDHRFVPHAVFTHPQIAAFGKTEQELREAGTRYLAYEQQVGDVAYGWALEDTTGFCKVIIDPDTRLLLGAHLMGPQASTVIQPLIQAAHFGQRADDVAKGQYWIHPALAEVVENALLGL
ncbi:MAG TPA: mycothione reductase [Lapillicoccus sp.]|jgi:mycothione reductase|uniref:mycothione reductase n=1 Tax=Lapillicoccus sp. TaxID=1909287 RepID=UPI002F94C83B